MMGSWLSGMRAGVMLAAVYGLLGSATVLAQTTPAANAQRGKQLSYTCLGCHGVEGYRNAYPEYSVPRLKGQHPEYLAAALLQYRSGERAHLTMHDQASTLADQDINDIALYFGGTPLVSTLKTPPPVPSAVAACVACHGADGISISPMFPTLAGQHEDYIVRALQEYKRGGRKNPIMAPQVAALKDSDISVVARYFASQTPGLKTESRPYTAFGGGSE
jgi:cytochrome c553